MSHPICFCLDCRTALHGDHVCDQDDDHRVVSLAARGAHEELVAAAWGKANVREAEHRQAIRVDQLIVTVTTIVLVLGLVGVWLLAALTLPHITGVVAAALATMFGGSHLLRARRPFPVGATKLLESAQLNGCGEVTGTSTLCSPATATLCVAYALELHWEGDGQDRVMYRDAVTCGFEVELDDGSVAHIPKGRIRIIGDMRQTMDVDLPELESYLAEVDARRAPDSPYDPFRHNVVYEAVVLPGDRIELLSGFEPRLSGSAPPTLYRKSMPSVLWPQTVPTIRQLTSTV